MLHMVDLQIDLLKVFSEVDSPSKLSTKSSLYNFRGMICYYGKHYTAYFKSQASGQWFVFDDVTVKPLGKDWSSIQQKCLRGRLQPSVLFYEREGLSGSGAISLMEPIRPTTPTNNSAKRESASSSPKPAVKPEESKSQNAKSPETLIPFKASHPVSPIPSPLKESWETAEDSFVFVPSPEERDFLVTRTNWMYRRQNRIFRLSKECFTRLLPNGEDVQEKFSYQDIFEISITGEQDIVISFYSEREQQHLHYEKIDDLVDAFVEKAKLQNHNFPVRRLQ